MSLQSISQIQIQNKDQLQSQKYSNFTMATMLSTAENLVWRICKDDYETLEFLIFEYSKLSGFVQNKLIFNNYNSYNSGEKKTIDSLINQFIFQIENFADDYNEYVEKYKNYNFPINMPIDQIKKIINNWIIALSYSKNGQNYIKYFINLRNVFDKEPIKSYEYEIREKYQNRPKTQNNIEFIINEYFKAMEEVQKKTADIDNQNLELWQ